MKAALGVILVILAGVLFLQWRHWPPSVPEPAPLSDTPSDITDASGPKLRDQEPMPRAESDYASIMERPLFLSERRPPPDEPVEAPTDDFEEEAVELAAVDLHATLIFSPTDASAWLKSPESPELIRLRLGDDYFGWTVAGIESDRVLMERQGETEQLDLYDFTQPAPQVQRTPLTLRQPRQAADERRAARAPDAAQQNRNTRTRRAPAPNQAGTPPPASR